nr:TFIIB-type zinc ribbon-containing protein [Candidatus Sigynarchaeota archaeon]
MVVNPREINIERDVEGEQEKCITCGTEVFFVDDYRGEKVCSACGTVMKAKIIDPGPEWRAFDADQKKKRTRVGAPLTYTIHDKGLSTIIDFRDRDVFGRKISPRIKAQVYRLRKWQR